MKTQQEIKTQIKKLTADLTAITADLAANREALTQAIAGPRQDTNGGTQESTAARIMVLEAREKATRQAIEQAEAEAGRVEDLLKSKEYKEAQKRMTELEKFFQVEADEIHNTLFLLRDRLKEVSAKYEEFYKLTGAYDNGARYRNGDYAYLMGISRIVSAQIEIENRAKATPAKTVPNKQAQEASAKAQQARAVHEAPALTLEQLL